MATAKVRFGTEEGRTRQLSITQLLLLRMTLPLQGPLKLHKLPSYSPAEIPLSLWHRIWFKLLRYKLGFCMMDWLVVLLFCIIPSFTCSLSQSMYLLMFSSMFFMVLMFYCGVHILCVLKQPRPGDGDRGGENWNSMKRKAFKVIMITLVFTGASQVLQVFMLGPALLYASKKVILWVTLVNLAVSIISGFITPLLYLHRAGKFPCIEF